MHECALVCVCMCVALVFAYVFAMVCVCVCVCVCVSIDMMCRGDSDRPTDWKHRQTDLNACTCITHTQSKRHTLHLCELHNFIQSTLPKSNFLQVKAISSITTDST